MTPQQAFKKTTGLDIKEGTSKAIEGGWKWGNWNMDGAFIKERVDSIWLYSKDGSELTPLNVSQIFLDPSFWSSLGKALRWKPIDISLDEFMEEWWFLYEAIPGAEERVGILVDDVWRYKQHSFLDHLNESYDK